MLQSVDSPVLENRVPGYLQDADNQWFGFSQRARIIFYDKTEVSDPPRTYLELADPRYKGLVCIRSSNNTYNQTLLASIIENHGAETARAWAEGVVANMARAPQGGDTDQLRGIVSGECEIAGLEQLLLRPRHPQGREGGQRPDRHDRLGVPVAERGRGRI